jgi:hypothetical protein
MIVAEIWPSIISMSILQDHDISRHQRLDGSNVVTVKRLVKLLDDALYFGRRRSIRSQY